MKALTISDSSLVLALQDEIRRSEEARYDHRLHAVLLIANGMKCPEVAKYLGDSERTVRYWVKRFNKDGFSGLVDLNRPGRPTRLTENHIVKINEVLRSSPTKVGMSVNIWDGKTLSAFIQNEFKTVLSVRQCQRLFKYLGFRLRKPRPKIAHANPELQTNFKKT